jgi:hypothetical protein
MYFTIYNEFITLYKLSTLHCEFAIQIIIPNLKKAQGLRSSSKKGLFLKRVTADGEKILLLGRSTHQ